MNISDYRLRNEPRKLLKTKQRGFYVRKNPIRPKNMKLQDEPNPKNGHLRPRPEPRNPPNTNCFASTTPLFRYTQTVAGLLTDLYQLTMAAGYFEAAKTREIAT